jgi:predicted permease
MFEVLGVRAATGRMLGEADDVRGGGAAGATAVISNRFWQLHFGGAADVVGRPLTLQRVTFTIAGVMPPGFAGPDVGRVADVIIPFGTEPLIQGKESFLDGRSTWWLEIMARRKPGQTTAQATAALQAIQPQIRAATVPPLYDARGRDEYLREGFVLQPASTGRSPIGTRFETPLVAMIGAVGLVLMIACANIANLLLARALARRQELSIRLALGASRGQIATLLVAESALLALAGGALGLLFAEWSGPLLVQQLGTWRQTVTLDLSPDWRVLGFTAGVTLVTAIAAGVAPAWGVTGLRPNDALKTGARGIAGDRHAGVRGALVVVQIALSIVLVVGAGLFVRTLSSLGRAPLGFTAESLLVADLNLQRSRLSPADRPAHLQRLRDAAAAVPGVRSAAVSMITPTSGRGWNTGVGEGPPDRSRMSWMNAVSPGWFATYGVRMIAGREFDQRDQRGGERVAVVNETFARRFMTGFPVGQTVAIGGGPGGGRTAYRVVGFVTDAVYRSPREGMVPTMYVPLAQREEMFPEASLTVSVVQGGQGAVMRELAAALKAADPEAAFTFRTFAELIGATVAQERLVALLSGFFGGLALLLAGIGLYGVMSHTINRRRTEIGVRMALGADPSGIVRLVFQRVSVLIGAGVAIGMGLSFWAAQYVRTMLFQLDPRDPATFLGAAFVLVAVGMAAAWLPARRAARLDPARVLRNG